MSINSLEKRIAVIENKLKIKQMDPDQAQVQAFDYLNENEIGLVEEYLNLSRSGFDVDTIREMLGEATYNAALAVFRKLESETARLMRGHDDDAC
ncbi:MAG: hypothetical protein ABR985_11420 [Methanotrichaceae archaeon]|jgi:hypothetical protein